MRHGNLGQFNSTSFTLGRALFGTGMAAFGVQNLISGDGVAALEPLPSWVPAHVWVAYVTGLALIVCGMAVMIGKRLRSAAAILAAMLGAWLVLLQLPARIAAPQSGWAVTFETLALCGGALMLVGPSPFNEQNPLGLRRWTFTPARAAFIGRICFGLSLMAFGTLHFIYHDSVASLIPAWIPGHLAWAYGIGVAFIAAGLSIVTDVQAQVAAALLGLMFGSWVFILHIPHVASAIHFRPGWTSLFIAMAMSGISLVIASRSGRPTSD